MQLANNSFEEMKQTSDRGLYFKAGEFPFSEEILITVSDASWANDSKIVANEAGEDIP